MPRAKAALSNAASSKEKNTGRSRSRLGSEKNEKSTSGRNENGQFAKGNPGGPGNPFARQTARMLWVFRNATSEEDLQIIAAKIRELAKEGDMAAAKLVLTYCIGKPREAPNPDELDRDEWRLFEQNAVNGQKATTVINSMPAKEVNGIVREVLPALSDTRTTQLAKVLASDYVPPPEPEPRPMPNWDGPKYATVPGNPALVPIAGPEWSLEQMLDSCGLGGEWPKPGTRKIKKEEAGRGQETFAQRWGQVGRGRETCAQRLRSPAPSAGKSQEGAPIGIGRNGG